MSNIDTLKLYDDLKAAGVPEEQAHAQAMAIYHANRVSPEDLIRLDEKIRTDFSNTIDKLIQKMDINFSWMRGIGIALLVAFIGNIAVNWYK
jgi:hypothetical protein